jgi:hypothetical protein
MSVIAAIMFGVIAVFGQTEDEKTPATRAKIPWKLTVLVLDGIDSKELAEKPVKKAVAFIEKNSRFKFEVEYVSSTTPHTYTPYKIAPAKKGRPMDTAYAMMGWNVPDPIIKSLPVSTSYLFLYRLKGKKPAQAGSALGLDFGLIKGGKPRPYATVPVDVWWYVNDPPPGVESSASQVLIHELINTIQARLEARPFKCPDLTAKGGQKASLFEAERLSKITDICYAKLEKSRD